MEYLYVIVFFIVLFILAYIKIKYPFWNIQPVYHYYDIYVPLFREPYIVFKNHPVITKFCDFVDVKTFSYPDITDEQLATLTNLVQCYTVSTEKFLYIINKENLQTYLTGQSHASFVSFYKDFEYKELTDPSGNENAHIDSMTRFFITEYKGCVTSRYVKIYILDSVWDAYYIDFMAIHRIYADANISRKLLQSHEYICQVLQPSIKISILRKEIDLYESVVPIVQFETAMYHFRDIRLPKLPPHFTVERIFKDNLDILTNFFHKIENNTKMFSISIVAEIGNILALIKKELLFVYCLKRREQVYSLYFIKDERIQYDENTENGALNLIASFHNSRYIKLFTLGFMHTMEIIRRFKRGYNVLLIDNIGHNVFITPLWKRKYSPILENKTAYYSINFIIPRSPFLKENVFILL